MIKNTDKYTLRTEISIGITHYYVSFRDGEGIIHETEVSRPVYLEIRQFGQQERNLRRSDERYKEQSNLTDAKLNERALHTAESVEKIVQDNLKSSYLQQIISELPETQRRRLELYHEFGLTFQQIADMEGCSKASVFRSINKAEAKIREEIKNKF